MAPSAQYLDTIKDLLEDFGPVQIKRMFGGAGVFYQGLMFGLVIDDVLHFKADDENRPQFDAEDLKPFIYHGKTGKPMQMGYFQAPERVMDDAEEMEIWAQSGFEAAVRADNAKPPSKRKRQ